MEKNKNKKSTIKPKEVEQEEHSEEPFSGESDEDEDQNDIDNQSKEFDKNKENGENKKQPEEEKKMGKFKGEPLKVPVKRRGSKFDIQYETSSPLLRPEFVYSENEDTNKKFWALMDTYQGTDPKSIQRSIVNHVEYTLAMTRFNFTNFGCYEATAYSIRDRMLEAWNDTNQYFTTNNVKRVYYLSLEFLLGRLMQNNLNNLDMESKYKDALMDIGYKLEDLYDQEVDPALGNGGLGRLAA